MTKFSTTPVTNRLVVVPTVGLVVAAAVVGLWLPNPPGWPVDFVQYRAASRVLLDGGNPYDGRSMVESQGSAGREDSRAMMMWNPPWVFPLVLPTGLMPWGSAYLAWNAVQLVVVVWACVTAWRIYSGPRHLWVPVVLAVSFAPVFFLLGLGQISGFQLFGLVAFLAALRAGRPGWAGVGAAFTAVKPQLLLPFALLFACDAIVSPRTRKALLVGGLTLLVAALVPMTWNRHVWSDYVTALRQPTDEYHYSVSDWNPPILSARFRQFVGGGVLVQFLPSIVASLALVAYWWVRRWDWDWEEQLPRVLLVSLLTTGYGAWGFDICVLLLLVVQAAAWVTNTGRERLIGWSGVAYVMLTAAMLTGRLGVLWWAPVVSACYVALAIALRSPTAGRSPRLAVPASS